VELQAATRKVAKENALLRSLLRQHGIPNAQVENHLHDKCDESETASSNPTPPSVAATPLRQLRLCDGTKSSQASETRTLLRQSSEPFYPPHLHMAVPSVRPNDSTHRGSRSTSDPTFQYPPHDASQFPSLLQDDASSMPLSTDDGSKCFESREPRSKGWNEDDATSCETAASIIANMRGLDDAEEARAELGCFSSINCTVKNMTIFRVMDR
jgi:hypothetical protein